MTNDSDCEYLKRVYDAFSALVGTCRLPHGVVQVSRWSLFVVQAIFRVVWEVEQAFPTAPQFWSSPGALVEAKLRAGCSPRDATRPAPMDAPTPGDCAR